ncbi:MAG TPA: 50S ribosomal protein L9 [bacterium]|nr:50S ribosomal protein L9 [bacterium]
MKIILREDVDNLGKSGQIVEVKDGYGRNFLLPRKLAVEATGKNLRQLEHEKRIIGDHSKKKHSKAEQLSEALTQHSCTILCQVGEQDKLFGAVTAMDIADQLRRDGFNVDRRQIALAEPLKQLGVFTVAVKLGEGVEASLKVWLVRK